MTRAPRDASRAPPLRFGTYPTPVEPLPSLSNASTGLWIKHDDRTSTLYGGNKVRKLEHILAQAKARGAERLVTMGAVGSHHVLATAIYGRQFGFEVEAVLVPQPRTDHAVANVRAGLAQGLRVFPVSTYAGVPPRVVSRLLVPGAFLVPPGGSSLAGAMGYVEAAHELASQVRSGQLPEPDLVVVAAGSGGTAAGLAAGLALEGLRSRVVGVSVTPPTALLGAYTRMLALRCLRAAGAPDEDVPARLSLEGGYLGAGYGHPTQEGADATERAAAVGIELDATYTAKAFAAALDLVGAARVATILYWHTLSTASMEPLLQGAPQEEALPLGVRRLLL
ncbi:MAG: pyridoxal-phosphate dependent enzyme [Myxococcota bacterium]